MLLLDAGALVALARNDRSMWVRMKSAVAAGEPPATHGGVVGQVWRRGRRQARLAAALRGVDVRPLDRAVGMAAGGLLAKSGGADVVDAALVALAADGDVILTGDVDDLRDLASAAGVRVRLIPV